ncbi:ABC transporter permease, partial [Pantoea agglomerans]
MNSLLKMTWQCVKSPVSNRRLIYTLTRREVISRYRGSVLGLLWSFFTPVLMLVVYTFIFSVVFQAKWSEGHTSKSSFALLLFSGLIIFN